MTKAVVLFSGGLDSTTTLAWAQSLGYQVYALSVDYGQRHRLELQRAKVLAEKLQVTEHRIVALDLRPLGGSALTSEEIAVPKERSEAEISQGIPVTYVPARNTILLSLALAYAEVVGSFDLFLGANVLDYSGYPDCRPEFLASFEQLANKAVKAAVESSQKFRIHAPLINMTKAEIIRRAHELQVDLSLTLSCYDPNSVGEACGQCDSCQLRRKGFLEAGMTDVTLYQNNNSTK